MKKTTLSVPSMYADHHIKAVRQVLTGLPGVADVLASAAFKRVVVEYDPAMTTLATIKESLDAAGYGPGEDWEIPSPPEGKEDDSTWFKMIERVTQTNLLDLQMSGDFRKY